MKKTGFVLTAAALLLLGGCSIVYSEKETIYYPIGDSITWLDGNEYHNSDQEAVGFPTIIEEQMGFDGVINKGISGASMAKNADYPNTESILLDNHWEDIELADTITILAGTNDFTLNVPVGELKENGYDETTYLGAYQTLIENIQQTNPEAEIYLVTPLQRNNAGYDIHTKNPAGHQLVDYVNGVKEVGEFYQLPVIDLYHNSQITMETLDEYTVDGLHPNNKGFEVMAREMMKVMQP